MTTLNTNDSLAKYYQPIEWPEHIKAEARSGWGVIALIVTGVAAIISLTSYLAANYKNYESAVMSPTSAPGQFSITFPEPPSSIWVNIFTVVALLTAIAVIVNSYKDDKMGTGSLAIAVAFLSVIFVIVPPAELSAPYLETDVPLTHMSEQAGVDFINSSYSKDNRIFSVNDDAASYNFLVSDGKTANGERVIYLTLQQ